ncbi:MAG: peptide/nickel transport system permease protein [Thermomicrobiales bacterium]|jgi:peptide/nickel transport system permease protein|nr:peptide/nickel transport system permease protein [Thermomicrobiales bacterium]
MGTYLARRLVGLVPVLLVISVVAFLTTDLVPGDAAGVLLGQNATPERAATVRKRLGLDQPLPIRYAKWMAQVAQGNLGRSILNQQAVVSLVGSALRVTLEQLVLSMLVAILIALPVGVVAAIRNGSWLDQMLMGMVLIGTSIPTFWLGLMLVYLFAVRWHILPPSGFTPLSEDLGQNLKNMILPSFALGVYLAGPLARFVRSSLIETMRQPYVVTARAKGLREGRVVRRHALKNALIPTVTFAGLQVGALIGGAIVTEMVFALPGMGSLALNGILNRDFPIIQGVVLTVAGGYVLINILIDVVYVMLDPRIKFAEAR